MVSSNVWLLVARAPSGLGLGLGIGKVISCGQQHTGAGMARSLPPVTKTGEHKERDQKE